MKKALGVLFGGIACSMVAATVNASKKEAIWKIPKEVTNDPWFKATLLDAYFGFFTFYTWVFYKEKSQASRLFWFAAIMLGGNAAMSSYMLLQLSKLNEGESVEKLLTARS